MCFKLDVGKKTRAWVEGLVDRVVAMVLTPRRTPTISLTLKFDRGGPTVEGEIDMFQLGDANKVRATLTPKDSRGNPVPLDQVEGLAFTSSDGGSLLSITQDPDGDGSSNVLSIAAVGPLGAAQVQFSFDNLVGEGGDVITGVTEIEVVPTAATNADFAFWAQEPQ